MPKLKSEKKVVKLRHEPLTKQIETKNGKLKVPKYNKSNSDDMEENQENEEIIDKEKTSKKGNKNIMNDDRWLNDDDQNDMLNYDDNDNENDNENEDDEQDEIEYEEDDDDEEAYGENIVELDGENFTPSGNDFNESEVILLLCVYSV